MTSDSQETGERYRRRSTKERGHRCSGRHRGGASSRSTLTRLWGLCTSMVVQVPEEKGVEVPLLNKFVVRGSVPQTPVRKRHSGFRGVSLKECVGQGRM